MWIQILEKICSLNNLLPRTAEEDDALFKNFVVYVIVFYL